MRSLLLRLTALDSDAEGAVRVISFFDALLARRADPAVIVATTARLTECPVGLDDPASGLRIRYAPDGRRLPGRQAPANAVSRELTDGGTVWIERHDSPLALDEIVVERLAMTVSLALSPPRGVAPVLGDPALVELVLSPSASDVDRARALNLLGLHPSSMLTVVAAHGPEEELDALASRLAAPGPVRQATIGSLRAVLVPETGPQVRASTGVRAGIGPRLSAGDAAQGWRKAVTAIRFTCTGGSAGATPAVPFGRPVVRWDDLGGFGLLADHLPAAAIDDVEDVAALDRLARSSVGEAAVPTLEAFCATGSVRGAATALTLHHSTVAARIANAERELGFRLDASGHARLSLALALRRLRDSASLTHGPNGRR
jgi:hypothetical protein